MANGVMAKIEVVDRTEMISSCNTCNRKGYHLVADNEFDFDYTIKLHEVRFRHNEHQMSIIVLCTSCLKEMVVAAVSRAIVATR